MQKFFPALPVFVAVVFFSSCARPEPAAPAAADLPHATVVMRDGTRVAGMVAASSPTEVTINLDGGGARTIPMNQVRRVDYGESAAAPAVQPARPDAPPPAPVRRPAYEPDPVHEEHYHPQRAAIQSRTRVLPVGTELPVRNEEAIDSANAVEGQVYAAEIAGDVRDAEGAVVIPRGSNAQIVIKSATRGSRFHGASDLVLDLQSVSVEGQRYQLSTADLVEKGHSGIGANKRTGEFMGGGAAVRPPRRWGPGREGGRPGPRGGGGGGPPPPPNPWAGGRPVGPPQNHLDFRGWSPGGGGGRGVLV